MSIYEQNGYLIEDSQYQHILVWETWYGTLVPYGYVIHHRDGNRKNNMPENLEIMSRRDHVKLHSGTVGIPDVREYIKVTCPDCGALHDVRYRELNKRLVQGRCIPCARIASGKTRRKRGN